MVSWFLGFLVSWFSVSWFRGFLVSWFLSFKDSWFQRFLVSWFRRFLVPWFQGFLVSWFQRFFSRFQRSNKSGMFLNNIWFILPNFHSTFFIDIDLVSKMLKMLLDISSGFSAHVFSEILSMNFQSFESYKVVFVKIDYGFS